MLGVWARLRAPTRKTEEAVGRRQNNGFVTVVSPRHCAAARRLDAIAVSAAGQSPKDNVRCTAVEEQLEAKKVQL